MRNPRAKGSRFERKIARELSSWVGTTLVRTPGSGAMQESFPGDLMPKDRAVDLNIMVECKHRENWNLDSIFAKWPDLAEVGSWWKQAVDSASYQGRTYIPLLVFKKNRYPPLIAIRIRDLPGSEIRTSRAVLLDLHSDALIIMPLVEFMERYRYGDL